MYADLPTRKSYLYYFSPKCLGKLDCVAFTGSDKVQGLAFVLCCIGLYHLISAELGAKHREGEERTQFNRLQENNLQVHGKNKSFFPCCESSTEIRVL